MNILQELRRRRVFRTTAMYIVAAWLVLQVADVVFPAWDIPEAGKRYLIYAAFLCFPLVIVFSWFFDVSTSGITRTLPASSTDTDDLSLQRRDYVLLAALLAVGVAIIFAYVAQIPAPVASTEERLPNSIAVLPFENLDSDPDTGYFSDGVSEEILNKLSASRDLHVLARTSSFALRDSAAGAAEKSALLGVEYLLEGSVRRDADLVRVTARLVDQAGEYVWSQSFDRELDNIFAIQAEIAGAVVAQISSEISASGKNALSGPTTTAEAYNEYLLGLSHTRSRARGWQEKAELAFRNVIELDPEYAPAWAGLAYSLFVMRPGGDKEQALNAAQQALQLDENLAAAHAIYGLITGLSDRSSLPAGERSLRRALELDSNSSDARNWLAIILERMGGSPDEVMAQRERGYAVDPLNPPLVRNFANDLARIGEIDRAETMLLRLTRIPEPLPSTYGVLWHINMLHGRFAKALQYAEVLPGMAARMRDQSEFNLYQRQMLSYAALGMTDDALELLDQLAVQEKPRLWFLVPGGDYPEGPIGARVLHSVGQHELAWERFMAVMTANGGALDDLESSAAVVMVRLAVFSGDYAAAIDVFQDRANGDPDWYSESIFIGPAYDALRATAFAYRKTGDDETADQILDAVSEFGFMRGDVDTPQSLALGAQLKALQNDADGAYALLTQAVDAGWADYQVAIHDPLWGDMLASPRFSGLLERVQQNLAEQRALVEARQQDQLAGQ